MRDGVLSVLLSTHSPPLPSPPLLCMFQNASAPPHPRSQFYFFNLWAPTHVHQFDDAAMDSKAAAFLKHASQCAPPPLR